MKLYSSIVTSCFFISFIVCNMQALESSDENSFNTLVDNYKKDDFNRKEHSNWLHWFTNKNEYNAANQAKKELDIDNLKNDAIEREAILATKKRYHFGIFKPEKIKNAEAAQKLIDFLNELFKKDPQALDETEIRYITKETLIDMDKKNYYKDLDKKEFKELSNLINGLGIKFLPNFSKFSNSSENKQANSNSSQNSKQQNQPNQKNESKSESKNKEKKPKPKNNEKPIPLQDPEIKTKTTNEFLNNYKNFPINKINYLNIDTLQDHKSIWRKFYLQEALQWHPDRHADSEQARKNQAEEFFKLLSNINDEVNKK